MQLANTLLALKNQAPQGQICVTTDTVLDAQHVLRRKCQCNRVIIVSTWDIGTVSRVKISSHTHSHLSGRTNRALTGQGDSRGTAGSYSAGISTG
jgi:hypothetical protein